MKASGKVIKVRLSETDVARVRRVSRGSVGEGLLFLIEQGVKHLIKKSA